MCSLTLDSRYGRVATCPIQKIQPPQAYSHFLSSEINMIKILIVLIFFLGLLLTFGYNNTAFVLSNGVYFFAILCAFLVILFFVLGPLTRNK